MHEDVKSIVSLYFHYETQLDLSVTQDVSLDPGGGPVGAHVGKSGPFGAQLSLRGSRGNFGAHSKCNKSVGERNIRPSRALTVNEEPFALCTNLTKQMYSKMLEKMAMLNNLYFRQKNCFLA